MKKFKGKIGRSGAGTGTGTATGTDEMMTMSWEWDRLNGHDNQESYS